MTEPERIAAGWNCPNIENHTACPEGYIQWHAWAEKMAKTHRQRKCEDCGLFDIWEPKPVRAILERQADHAEAAELRAEVERLREAGSRLIANVLARHPGEKLRCPDMIALAAALEKTT